MSSKKKLKRTFDEKEFNRQLDAIVKAIKCEHPEHDPPNFWISPGQVYKHICPSCNLIQTIYGVKERNS